MEQIDWTQVKIGDKVVLTIPEMELTVADKDPNIIIFEGTPDMVCHNRLLIKKDRLTPENFRVIPAPKFKAGDVVRMKREINTVIAVGIDSDGTEALFLRSSDGIHGRYYAHQVEIVEAAK